MNPPDILEVLLKVTASLDTLNIPYYIGGSLASSAYGIPRATLDADIAADVRTEHVSGLCRLLSDEFYCDETMMENAIKNRSSFNLIHLKTMFKVDVFVLKDRAYEREALKRRMEKSVSEETSTKFFWEHPEDVILHKLEWYKAGGMVSERQWDDVLGMLRVQGDALHMEYLHRWAENLGVSELLQKALNEK